ncbi:hypothetical protein SDC9_119009 [bioreactor metagenome]|uniref:Uncharacterized protein n=1 Tax=bioreactor metagenome TaxID=1076179 RepID=A0A645C2I7_9ZZZZ
MLLNIVETPTPGALRSFIYPPRLTFISVEEVRDRSTLLLTLYFVIFSCES